jgi:hypothetical protein
LTACAATVVVEAEWARFEREKKKADALKAKLEAQERQIREAEQFLQRKRERADRRQRKHTEHAVCTLQTGVAVIVVLVVVVVAVIVVVGLLRWRHFHSGHAASALLQQLAPSPSLMHHGLMPAPWLHASVVLAAPGCCCHSAGRAGLSGAEPSATGGRVLGGGHPAARRPRLPCPQRRAA